MRTTRLAVAAAAATALTLSMVVCTTSAHADVTYGVASAPLNVTASAAAGGVQVSWTAPASDGNSAITGYIVDGGQGTCPVYIDASKSSAFVPALAGQGSRSFSVTAVNNMGFGAASTPSQAVTAADAPQYGFLTVDKYGTVAGVAGSTISASITRRTYIAALPTSTGKGAWVLSQTGTVTPLGDAASIVNTTGALRVPNAVAIVAPSSGPGFYVVSKTGAVAAYGGAAAISGTKAAGLVIGAAASRDGGLWLVGASGAVAGVGGAQRGSLPRGHYSAVIGRATGEGFWAVQSNGAVAAFGDAPAIAANVGSVASLTLAANGRGFYATTRTGSIIAAGDVPAAPAAVPAGTVVASLAPAADFADAQILALSDFHGALDYTKSTAAGFDTYTSGAATLAANFAADRANNPATFTLSSGDNWGAAPPVSTAFDEFPSVDALNDMAVDVTTFGNHEHDKDLAHVKSRINASKFQWVVSNYSSLTQLQANNAVGAPVAPWTIIDRGGVKVGVIGMNTPETPQVVFPGNMGNIAIGDVLDSNAAAAASARAQVLAAIKSARLAGADMVVALVHEGFGQYSGDVAGGRLLDIAPMLQGSSVVLGGHSHLKFGSMVSAADTNRLVAEVPNAGVLYNRAHICVNRATRTTVGSRLEQVVPTLKVSAGTAVTSLPSAFQVANTHVNGWKSQLSGVYNQVIGSVAAVAPNNGSPQIQRNYETGLGDFIADTMRSAYNTDIAVTNGGGIRATLPAQTFVPSDASITRPLWTSAPSASPWQVTSTGPYPLTYGDVATVLPFGNAAVTTRITGADLWAAMNNGTSQVELGAGRFPQISGFKFTWDRSRTAGSRVTSITLADGTPVPNSNSVSFSLATNDFMVAGGDGYTMFPGLANAKTRDSLETLVREALRAKSAQVGAVSFPTDGRITRLN